MGFDLIKSVDTDIKDVDRLLESCAIVTEDVVALCERADRWLGKILAMLNRGQNPFDSQETKEIVAGLMTIADEDNRDALNIDEKRFNLIQQFKDDQTKDYVQNIGRVNAPSLVDKLDDFVADRDKRDDLKRRLFKIQTDFSRVKDKAQVGRTPGITRKAGGMKLA